MEKRGWWSQTKLFLGITLDLKRNLLVFLILLLLLLPIPFTLSYLNHKVNVIGVIDVQKNGLEIKGYAFNFYGKGERVQVVGIVNNTHLLAKGVDHSENGSFALLYNLTPNNTTTLTLVINGKNYTIFLNDTEETFAFPSLVKGEYISSNLSIISVKGIAVVASVNPIKVDNLTINSSIFIIRSNLPIYFKESWYGDKELIAQNKIYIIGILTASSLAVEILGYFSLAQFPRRELEEIMRLKGVAYVYFSKFFSFLTLGFIIFLVPLTLYVYVEDLPLAEIFQSVIVAISLISGLIGIYQFFNSRDAALTSIILADYVLDLVYFNLIYFSLLSLILLTAGYVKIRLKYL